MGVKALILTLVFTWFADRICKERGVFLIPCNVVMYRGSGVDGYLLGEENVFLLPSQSGQGGPVYYSCFLDL